MSSVIFLVCCAPSTKKQSVTGHCWTPKYVGGVVQVKKCSPFASSLHTYTYTHRRSQKASSSAHLCSLAQTVNGCLLVLKLTAATDAAGSGLWSFEVVSPRERERKGMHWREEKENSSSSSSIDRRSIVGGGSGGRLCTVCRMPYGMLFSPRYAQRMGCCLALTLELVESRVISPSVCVDYFSSLLVRRWRCYWHLKSVCS